MNEIADLPTTWLLAALESRATDECVKIRVRAEVMRRVAVQTAGTK